MYISTLPPPLEDVGTPAGASRKLLYYTETNTNTNTNTNANTNTNTILYYTTLHYTILD